ncbi:Toll/interleukin-1 receptor domain-containing protein, partial [Tanacetum coccineum]
MSVDVDSTAHGVWKRLKDLFHDNKDARITQLDNEIRNMVIGTSSITDFFQLIKSKADRLANLDSPVKDSSLVTYAINGMCSKYPDAARVIRLREKAHTFDELRSMMLLEESDMAHTPHGNSIFHNTSSSPTVLVAFTTTSDKSNTMGNSGLEVCRNFKRGSCSYGTRCKFVHGDHDMRPRPNTHNSVPGNVSTLRGQNTLTCGPVSGSGHTSSTRGAQNNSSQVPVNSLYPMQPLVGQLSPYSMQPNMGFMYFQSGLGPNAYSASSTQPTQPAQAHLATANPTQQFFAHPGSVQLA